MDSNKVNYLPQMLVGGTYTNVASSYYGANPSVLILNSKLVLCITKESQRIPTLYTLDSTRQWTTITDINCYNAICRVTGIADGKLYMVTIYPDYLESSPSSAVTFYQVGTDTNWTAISGIPFVNANFPFSVMGIQAGKLYYITSSGQAVQIGSGSNFVDVSGMWQTQVDSGGTYNNDSYSLAVEDSGKLWAVQCRLQSTSANSSIVGEIITKNEYITPSKIQGRGFYIGSSTNRQVYSIVFGNPQLSGDTNSIYTTFESSLMSQIYFMYNSEFTYECSYVSSCNAYGMRTFALSKGHWFLLTKANNSTRITSTLLSLSPSPIKIQGAGSANMYPLSAYEDSLIAYALYDSGSIAYFNNAGTSATTISGVSGCVDILGQGSPNRYTALALCNS